MGDIPDDDEDSDFGFTKTGRENPKDLEKMSTGRKMPGSRHTFAKSRKESGSDPDGSVDDEGEVSSSAGDVSEEPSDDGIRKSDSRHNLGATAAAAFGGSSNSNSGSSKKPASSVGRLQNFTLKNGVGDASREMSRI